MDTTDKIIKQLFESRWVGDSVLESIDTMKDQLYKTLSHQLQGFWSGHTAYHICVDGGFLKDSKFREKKELTAFGQAFMESYAKARRES